MLHFKESTGLLPRKLEEYDELCDYSVGRMIEKNCKVIWEGENES